LTKIETRVGPDDLARVVDLPPTEAGGEPKSEEHMTDKEKAARAKVMDAAPVNKMAE
jgi:hypothetical protein